MVLRVQDIPTQTYRKGCTDWYQKTRRKDGTLEPSDLWIWEEDIIPILVNMEEMYQGTLQQDFNNIPLVCHCTKDWSPPGGWQSIELTDTEYVTKLLARTNPFAYTVSVPIMIFELVEAASLLALSRANFLTLGGSAYLNYEFGISPFMEDIKALYKITSAIEKKIIDLNRLIKKGGLRTKAYLGSKSYTDPNQTIFSGWSGYSKGFDYSIQVTSTSKVWGTCRWRLKRQETIDVAKLTSVNNAIRICLDLRTPDFSTIWEMIPFSWLVDYFLNVGDTLQAIESSDLVEPYDICIMRTRTFDTELRLVPKSWHNAEETFTYRSVSANVGRYTCKHKLRTVRPTPTGVSSLLAYGFINEAQATNLTALLLSLARHRR